MASRAAHSDSYDSLAHKTLPATDYFAGVLDDAVADDDGDYDVNPLDADDRSSSVDDAGVPGGDGCGGGSLLGRCCKLY